MSDLPKCRLCGSDPLPEYHNPELIGCGAGAKACDLTDDPDHWPSFTKEQWIAIMTKEPTCDQ